MQVFFDNPAKIRIFTKENRLTLQKLGESVAFLDILAAINNTDNLSIDEVVNNIIEALKK